MCEHVCKVVHYTLRFYQSLNMCLLGVCYKTHTILEVMKLTPGVSVALDMILSLAWFLLLGEDSGIRKGEGEEPRGCRVQLQLIETILSPVKHSL